jgi:ELWxxDGT repeat protein
MLRVAMNTDGSATLQFAASVYIYSQMIAIGGTLYFAGYDQELWASDGTQKGTTQVADINQQKDCWPVPYGEERCRDIGSYPNQFVGLHGRVYFFATSGYWEPTQELWTSDGTMEGTTLVAYKEFTGHPDLEPADLTAASGRLLLTGEVISDTTTPEFRTLLVVDPAQDASQPATRVTSAGASIVVESHLHRMGDAVYFLGTRSGGRVGLWRMDPTATEPTLVKDDLAAPGGYAAQYIADADGTLFLRGRDATHGTELWRSDGIEAGTRLVADINPGTADADIGGADGRVYTSLGNLFIFAATSEAGVQLWRSDGTLAGTFALPGSVAPTSLAQVGDAVYVAATDATTGAPALWRTDGTVEGTALVQAFPSGTVLRELTAFGDTVIFTSVRASAYAVWTSDGTPTGTRELNSYRLPVQGGTVPLQYYAVIDKRVFFAAGDAGDTELWRSDGTHDGTQRYLDINAGVAPSEPRNITNIGGRLMFSADNGVGVGYRHEVWLVDDVDPNHQQTFYFVQGDASGFLRTGRFVYFVAHDYQYGRELWRASFRFDPQATLMLPSVAR